MCLKSCLLLPYCIGLMSLPQLYYLPESADVDK